MLSTVRDDMALRSYCVSVYIDRFVCKSESMTRAHFVDLVHVEEGLKDAVLVLSRRLYTGDGASVLRGDIKS